MQCDNGGVIESPNQNSVCALTISGDVGSQLDKFHIYIAMWQWWSWWISQSKSMMHIDNELFGSQRTKSICIYTVIYTFNNLNMQCDISYRNYVDNELVGSQRTKSCNMQCNLSSCCDSCLSY